MTLPARKTREKLVAETLALMEAGGLEAVKARDLAKRTGVSVGTIYNLHGSLEGLIADACDAILAEFAAVAMQTIRAGEVSRARRMGGKEPRGAALLEDRLLAMARVYMAYVEKNERRWAAMLAFNRTRKERPQARYEQLQGDLFGFVADALEGTRYAASAQMRVRTARMLWSAVHGIVTMNYVGQAGRRAKHETWEQVKLLVAAFVESAGGDS